MTTNHGFPIDLCDCSEVVQHLGRVAVLAPVLDEVRGVTAAQCAHLGIEVVEVETEQMLEASEIHFRMS